MPAKFSAISKPLSMKWVGVTKSIRWKISITQNQLIVSRVSKKQLPRAFDGKSLTQNQLIVSRA
ncbi:hypothetical protein SK128_022757, partial [Halocaridina rubra]